MKNYFICQQIIFSHHKKIKINFILSTVFVRRGVLVRVVAKKCSKKFETKSSVNRVIFVRIEIVKVF
jgi:hypothetical protein